MDLGLLIHRYGKLDNITRIVAEQLRNLAEAIESSDKFQDTFILHTESWTTITDHPDNMKCFELFKENRHLWKEFLKDSLDTPKRIQTFGFSSHYNSYNRDKYRTMHFSGRIVEKLNFSYIEITVPSDIRKCIDQEVFIKAVKQACVAMKATYACVDYAPYSPGAISIGHFYKYCDDLDKLNADEYLPGLYWAQYLTPQYLQKTGTLEQVVKDAPCPIKEILASDDHEGVWLQMSPTLKKVNGAKMLALRNYFEASVPPISIEKIMDSLQFLWGMLDSKFFPFTVSEKEELIQRGYKFK